MDETRFSGLTSKTGRYSLVMTGPVTSRTIRALIKQLELYAEFADSPIVHESDCTLHNAPALPVGPCDCGVEDLPKSAN